MKRTTAQISAYLQGMASEVFDWLKHGKTWPRHDELTRQIGPVTKDFKRGFATGLLHAKNALARIEDQNRVLRRNERRRK